MADPDPMSPITDAFLDRIVDGALSPAELRGAIERLEREPHGWKRCALAFLEEQGWRESFRAETPRAPMIASGNADALSQSLQRSGRRSARWRRVAMAAGLASISFALGWRTHPDRSTVRETTVASASGTMNPSPRFEDVGSNDLVVSPRDISSDEGPPADPTPPVLTVGHLRVDGSEGAPGVPIVVGPGIDEEWVRNQPPPITEHQQAILEQQGFQVDRHRRLISARLSDGQRLTVPVDHVQVRFTGIEPL